MGEKLPALLKAGEEIVAALRNETFACLRNLENFSQEEVIQFLRLRQQRAEELETFTSTLRIMDTSHCRGDKHDAFLIANFWNSCRDALKEILETDALIRALAERRQMPIRGELDAITRGQTAMQGYRGKDQRMSSSRNRIG